MYKPPLLSVIITQPSPHTGLGKQPLEPAVLSCEYQWRPKPPVYQLGKCSTQASGTLATLQFCVRSSMDLHSRPTVHGQTDHCHCHGDHSIVPGIQYSQFREKEVHCWHCLALVSVRRWHHSMPPLWSKGHSTKQQSAPDQRIQDQVQAGS